MALSPKKRQQNEQIIALNSIGLPLTEIAEITEMQFSTVKNRMIAMGIEPSDTRRSFMKDIYLSLNTSQREWLISKMVPGTNIMDFVRSILITEYARNGGK
jgi:hypothetical protein